MEFRIADTFTDSLAKLSGDEQKAAKTTAFDLQLNPANPGHQFHKLDRTKDKRFWSVRVSRDIRLIVHRADSSLMLCYVDHHDAAYRWAERRKLERHPKTGAAQFVEIREAVREIEIPKYVVADEPVVPAAPLPRLFESLADDELLGYGVPTEWLDDVRHATEDTLLDLSDHLPSEAAEALLELATGSTPAAPVHVAEDVDPFTHPDAQRRFRVMTNADELKRALDYPWEKWTVFLHPAQRDLVERRFNGPARVAGSAGTGKTIVALHRAVHLARTHPNARILLTTFSRTLAGALRVKLQRLAGTEHDLVERISVQSMDEVGLELYSAHFGKPQRADDEVVRELVLEASKSAGDHRFTPRFLVTEWVEVVDAWQLRDWESYRDVKRLGRKRRLGEQQRKQLWSIFETVRQRLSEKGLMTVPDAFERVTDTLAATDARPYDFIVVDEAQDVGVPQLRCLAALAAERPEGLFFAGDLGQRIFQTPFSWKSLGVDIRGRSHTLRINYRTSHQIRRKADCLLPGAISDVDGNEESRRGTVSVFNGPDPVFASTESEDAEIDTVSSWIGDRVADGTPPHEVGVVVRSSRQVARARRAVEAAGHSGVLLSGTIEPEAGRVSVCTMHNAKGLEFPAVVVMACDDDVIPLEERVAAVADDTELEEVYNTERHLLYVACTRARDHLLVTGVAPASEFLDDLTGDLRR